MISITVVNLTPAPQGGRLLAERFMPRISREVPPNYGLKIDFIDGDRISFDEVETLFHMDADNWIAEERGRNRIVFTNLLERSVVYDFTRDVTALTLLPLEGINLELLREMLLVYRQRKPRHVEGTNSEIRGIPEAQAFIKGLGR